MRRSPYVHVLLMVLLGGCSTLKPMYDLGDGGVSDAEFSPDGSFVAAATNGTVRVWSTGSGKLAAKCEGYADGYGQYNARPLVFSPDGELIAFAAGDGTVRIWQWRGNGQMIDLPGHPNRPGEIVITSDGRVVSVSGGYSPGRSAGEGPTTSPTRQPVKVLMWKLETATEIARWQNEQAGVLFTALSEDGRTLATVGVPGLSPDPKDWPSAAHREIAIWDAKSGARRRAFEVTGEFLPVHLALSPDGRSLFTSGPAVGNSATGTLYDVEMGTARAVDIRGARFSPDGAILSGIADLSKDVGPAFGIFGLAIPPRPKPKIRLTQVEAATGRKLLDREITTQKRTFAMAATSDLSLFIDLELQLWRTR